MTKELWAQGAKLTFSSSPSIVMSKPNNLTIDPDIEEIEGYTLDDYGMQSWLEYIRTVKTPPECDCGAEKHNFPFHVRGCPAGDER